MKQRIDWSLLQGIANPIADLITSNKNAAYAKQVFGSGAPDWNSAVQRLLAAGDVAGAAKVAAISKVLKPDAMSPYESAKIAIEERKLGLPPSPKIGSVVEEIRRKLSSGEALSKGEQKVYDDAIRKDAFAELLKPVPPGVGPVANPGEETPPESGNLAPLSFPPLANAEPPADPRGAYLPEAGNPQGMNRQAAPDGTVITNGTSRLKKENGKWVPF